MRLLIKLGGTLLDCAEHRRALAQQIAAASQAGNQIVIVHGGGRQLSRFLEESGIESRFVNGLRVTSPEAVDAVVKVLAGTVNTQLVGALRREGIRAVGLTGLDGGLTHTSCLSPELGWVGRIDSFDPTLLELLTRSGFVPVIACVGGDDSGDVWNINADQMAAACARSFGVARLIFLTDVAGVMDGSGNVLATLNADEVRGLIHSGVARGGMQAKLEAALSAVSEGVGDVAIAPGATDEILDRLLRGESAGTVLVNS